MIAEAVLERVAALIVEACRPEAVILFGSQASGRADCGSDVDLIVVGRFACSQRVVQQELAEMLDRFPVSFDLLLLSPEEVLPRPRGHDFIASILHGARLIHANPGFAKSWNGAIMTPVGGN